MQVLQGLHGENIEGCPYTDWNLMMSGPQGPTGTPGSFDINGLTQTTFPDTDDELAMYNQDAGANRKVNWDDNAVLNESWNYLVL